MLKSSKNKEAAHAFINYILDPEIHGWAAENILYKVPNKAAMDAIDPALKAANAPLQMTRPSCSRVSPSSTSARTRRSSPGSPPRSRRRVRVARAIRSAGRAARGRAGACPGAARLPGPGLTYLIVLLLVPLALLLSYMLFRGGRFGGVVYELTGENFTRLFDPLYLDVVLGSLKIAALATVIALLVGYPTAYLIAQLPGSGRRSRWSRSCCRSGRTS